MARVIWLEEAVEQLDGIIAYIEQFDPDAARRMAERLISLGESLAAFPHRGRSKAHGVHELATAAPYILRYRVFDDRVMILGVRHSARRPLD